MDEQSPDHGPPSAQLDLGRLSEISSGDADFEREIVAEYLEQAWGLFEMATQALAAKDADALRRATHTLKGSSRTVGAEGVALAAAALETAATTSTHGTAPLLGHVFGCLIVTEREFGRVFRDGHREAA